MLKYGNYIDRIPVLKGSSLTSTNVNHIKFRKVKKVSCIYLPTHALEVWQMADVIYRDFQVMSCFVLQTPEITSSDFHNYYPKPLNVRVI